MKQLLLTFFFITFYGFAYAQTCTNCQTTYNNHVGNIMVRNNETVCITGTFSGSIDLTGGKLSICATTAVISSINYKQPSEVTIGTTGKVTIQNINSNKAVNIVNYCRDFTIVTGTFDQPFKLVNFGIARLNGGSFNGTMEIVNNDSLFINTNLTLNRTCTFTNNRYFELNGNFNPNSANVVFNNSCQLKINGDMTLNGQTLDVKGGYFRVNNLNMNAGSIVLNDATVCYVNQLNVGGFVEGRGSRSTLVCERNPNLNKPNSFRGNLSICVKTGNFNPNPGTIQSPAAIDCDNAIGGSDCNPEPFGYPLFRLVPDVATAWKNSSNWEMLTSAGWKPAATGKYPTAGSAVIIGNGKKMTIESNIRVSKLILGETASAQLIVPLGQSYAIQIDDSLLCATGSEFTLNGNGSIMVKGKLLSTVQISGGNRATVAIEAEVLNGSQLKMSQLTPGQTNLLEKLTYNLSNNSVLSLADTLIVLQSVQPKLGILQTNNKLILESNRFQTASILGGSGNYIQGSVIVKHYIPSIARRYRFVTSPVSNATLLDWQQEVFITGNNAAGNAIGNTIGQLNSAGFDATSNNNPSMFSYNETIPGNLNDGWGAVTNESNSLQTVSLPPGKGYRLFIRGDRSDLGRLDGSNTTQNEVTLSVTGIPNTGDITVPIAYTESGNLSNDGWNLIGNPYPSAFDWKAFYDARQVPAGIEPIIWTYDPNVNSYISYNALTGAGTLQDGLVPSGVSFWVKAKATSGPIIFKEQYKTTNPVTRVARSSDVRTDEITVNLIKDSINADDIIVKFKFGALRGRDSFDILKFWGGDFGLAVFNDEDGSYQELSARPVLFGGNDQIQLYQFGPSGNYKLQIGVGSSFYYSNSQLFLLDKYLDVYTEVRGATTYEYTVDENVPGSADTKRFVLFFIPTKAPDANVNYLFAEKLDSAKVQLTWGSLIEPLPVNYTVERGFGPDEFAILANVTGSGSIESTADYAFVDSTFGSAKTLYYRIGYNDSVNFAMRYTPVILFDLTTGLQQVASPQTKPKVYPNPASSYLFIELETASTQPYNYSIVDVTGKIVRHQLLQPSNKQRIQVDDLPQGVYWVNIQGGASPSIPVKFIKF
ncbi:MAG: T9SS type A sorting domain-containing protein [Bacteroidia bacterium]|jgi:hypothetical protein|nr:T9SS type A sorting domain-containing protein [Bacteroidia bacterium]